MAYLPDGVPGPEPTFDDNPFWEHCAKGELRFQRCGGCGLVRNPPGPACPRCQSFACDWVAAGDDAELFSFTVVHYSAQGAIAPALPYNVAIVRFPSLNDVRLVSNVIDTPAAGLRIGMELALVFETAGNGRPVPRFRPKGAA